MSIVVLPVEVQLVPFPVSAVAHMRRYITMEELEQIEAAKIHESLPQHLRSDLETALTVGWLLSP